jgi:hypothetical protein
MARRHPLAAETSEEDARLWLPETGEAGLLNLPARQGPKDGFSGNSFFLIFLNFFIMVIGWP